MRISQSRTLGENLFTAAIETPSIKIRRLTWFRGIPMVQLRLAQVLPDVITGLLRRPVDVASLNYAS